MNGYNLIRAWYNFKFENPDITKPSHSDLYCFLVDKWNRLGQKEKFGLPTDSTLESMNLSYNSYKKYLKDLVDFGFIIIVKESKNQHQSKIVALSKVDKALDKALDKASIKALDESFDETVDESFDSINKQLNKGTIEQINKGVCEFENLVCDYFSQTTESHRMKVHGFLRSLKNKKKYKDFETQTKAYIEYKKLAKEKIHGWWRFQSDWEDTDWVDKLKKQKQNLQSESKNQYQDKKVTSKLEKYASRRV